MYDSAGVTIVEHDRLPQRDDARFAWRLDTLRTVDANQVTPAGEPTLFDPRRFAVLEDGTLVVLDGGPQPITVLAPSGAVTRIASWGQGPGQIQSGFVSLAPMARDEFATFDISNRRVTRFALNGKVIADTPLDIGDASFQWLEVLPSSGEAFAHLWYVDRRSGLSTTLGDSVRRVYPPWPDSRVAIPLPKRAVDVSSNRRSVLFDSRLVFAALNDGSIVTTRNDGAEFRYFGQDGELRSVVRLPLHPLEIDPLEHAEILDEFSRVAGASASGVNIEINSHYPIFTLLRPLGDTVFVVEHSHRGSPAGDPRLSPDQRSWRLLSVHGRYLGSVVLPAGFMPALTLDFEVIGITTDSLGLQRVHHFRITPANMAPR